MDIFEEIIKLGSTLKFFWEMGFKQRFPEKSVCVDVFRKATKNCLLPSMKSNFPITSYFNQEGDSMSAVFGNKKTFALEYAFSSPVCADDNGTDENWGTLKVWINNKDIGHYRCNDEDYDCECNLYELAEWLCEKIEYIAGYDPYPLPVEGDTLAEMIKNTDRYENEDDSENDLWYDAKSRWIFNHCWFSCRDGAVLPCVYFRRIREKIEISWDNRFWKENGIIFTSEEGTYCLNIFEFKKIIKAFLSSVIDDTEQNTENKKQVNKLKAYLDILG